MPLSIFLIAGRSLDNRASLSSSSFARSPSVNCDTSRQYSIDNSCEDRKESEAANMITNLLPSYFFLSECIQRFIQRIGDDSPHSLVPTPICINACFPQQMHKCLFALLQGSKAVVWNHRIVREVWSCGKDAARGKWEDRTRVRNRAI